MADQDHISRRHFMDHSGKLVLAAAAAGVLPQARGAEAEKPKARCDSYCGLYCGACPNMLKSQAAKKPEDVKCLGCKSGKTAKWCSKCKIKDCAQANGVEFCSECEAYPCPKLDDFHNCGKDYRLLAAKNLEAIQEKGGDAWLKEQKKRWTCPTCKARFSWRDEVCPKCRKDLLSCKDEAKALKK